MIKNYMELLVNEIYNEVKILYGNCNSPECEHNIKSTALNNLSASYFSYDASEGEKKAFLLERQRRITVLAKVAEAAESICLVCNKKEK